MEATASVAVHKRVSPYAVPGLARRKFTPVDIDQLVAEYFDMEVGQLSEKTRKREIVMPRQLAMYFQKNYTRQPLATIGRRYGKDHATVLHACRTVENLYDTDAGFRQVLSDLSFMVDYHYQLSAKLKK